MTLQTPLFKECSVKSLVYSGSGVDGIVKSLQDGQIDS